jgi:SAM-dependent methyltransferase
MVRAYENDLAYIHDAGFGHIATNAAPFLLRLLRQHGKDRGLVIELGCGSGISARAIVAAGYDVLGFDISAEMIALARRRVPAARFRTESFVTAELPPCVAVTAIGEPFNYLFDPGNTKRALAKLLRRIHDALQPGGLLLFDVAAPGRVPGPGPQRIWRAEEDWAVLVETEADRQRRLLTRRITSFRKVGELYRRDHEVHRQRLLERSELAAQLRGAGFRVWPLAGYGPMRFARGHIGFLARKP